MKKLKKTIFVILAFVLTFINYSVVTAVEVTISDNGSGSDSEVNITQDTQTTVVQSNESVVKNAVEITSNSGGNEAILNSGNTTIVTGDVASEVAIENSGNISSVDTSECCQGETTTSINGNGADSENTAILNSNTTTTFTINQNTKITNNIVGIANTGNNNASFNTGDVYIKTGSISVSQNIQNGPINGYSLSGSNGSNGNTTINVSDNGANSLNSALNTAVNATVINVTNNALIDNNIVWDLNTGNNYASGNIGDVSIVTGDISFVGTIKNGPINFGFIDWKGCCEENQADDPADPADPGDPGDNGGWTVEDTNKSSNPAVGGASVASTDISKILEVLGLSDTSGEKAIDLQFAAGVIMILLGIKFVGDNSFSESLRRQNT